MTVKQLTEHLLEFLSVKGGGTGSSESSLVKITHCWKSHVTAPIIFHSFLMGFVADKIHANHLKAVQRSHQGQ